MDEPLLNEDKNHIERGAVVGPLQEEEHQKQHRQQQQGEEARPGAPPFTSTTIAQEQTSAYHDESLSQSKFENTMKKMIVESSCSDDHQQEQQLKKNPLPATTPPAQGPFLPSNSFPYFNLAEVDNAEFVRNISNTTAKEVNKNERKTEPEAQKRQLFSSIKEKEQGESSHIRTKKKLNEAKAFDVAFTAESSIQSLPPSASNNHTKNILMTMNESRSFFTADEERRESSIIPLSTTASLLVGESNSRANTHHIHSPRRKERKDEEMPFLQLRGYDDTRPVNNKNLVHSCNTGLAEWNEHSSEKQSLSFDPDPSLQAFDAKQKSKKRLFREYPTTMSSGPFPSYTTSDDGDRGKQIASVHYNNAESHDKDTSIAKQVSTNKKTVIDPSQTLLLQGGVNTLSLLTRDNSSQEASPCKPMIIKSHENMNKLIDAFFSSDDMMKNTFNVSGGKQEQKKGIVTYKFPLKLYFMVASGLFENIIKWTSKGKAFQIMNKDKFVAEVLPLVFAKAAKFSSFHRKLNRWKFEKVQKEMNTWMHPLFQQDRPDLCRKICATNSALEQNLSIQDLLMMRNQGNASVRQQGKTHQQEVLVAPVTRNDVPSFPYYYPLTLFQNNLGSTQNFSIQNMQSSVYSPNQYMLLPTNLQQQGGQQAPVAIGGGMQQQQGLSNLPMSNQHSQMTRLGMTAGANQLEGSMLHNQVPSTYAGTTTAAPTSDASTINSSGGMVAFDIMTRNDLSFANCNSGYMNNFDVKFSNLKKEGIHHTRQVSTSSCRDTMRAQNFLPLPPNLQNQPNLSATNEQIANTGNLMQQTPNEAYAPSVGPFGTNLVSSNTPSISGFSSSVLGSDSQITNGGLGSKSRHVDVASADMGPQQSLKPTTGGDSLMFSRDPIESRALEEGPDNKMDETDNGSL